MSENFLQFPSRDLAEIHLCSTNLENFDRLFASRRKYMRRRLCGEKFSDNEEFSWKFPENFYSNGIFARIFRVNQAQKFNRHAVPRELSLFCRITWWIKCWTHADIFQSRNPSETNINRGFIQLLFYSVVHCTIALPSRSASLRTNAEQKREKKNENTVVYELMRFYSIKFCGGLLKYFKSILSVAWMGSVFRMGMNVLKWKVRITPTVPKNLGGLLCRYHSVSNVLSGIWTFTFYTLGWLSAPSRERCRTRQ